MKTLTLTQGRFAIVDDVDYEWLIQWKWYAKKHKLPRGEAIWYAARHGFPRGTTVFMHRELLIKSGVIEEFNCDHRDGNGLNNQLSNLRACSKSQNSGNRKKSIGLSSRFKGVTWHCRDKVWSSRIMVNGIRQNLGSFQDERDAAKAYDRAAISGFGEFAKPNFP